MKWVIVIIILLFLPIVFLSTRAGYFHKAAKKSSPVITHSTPTPPVAVDPTPTGPRSGEDIEVGLWFEGKQLTIHAYEIPKGSQLQLIGNFSERKTGQTLVDEFRCNAAINGGFYIKEGKPLGLFIAEGRTLGEAVESNVATGFFWQYKSGERFIGTNLPVMKDELDFIFQSGPLMQVGKGKLSLVNDEQARRSLLGITRNNLLYFFTIFDPENTYSGPYLADMPQITAEDAVQKVLPFVTLLNLDGGSASFYFATGGHRRISFSEITPIGSLLCLQ